MLNIVKTDLGVKTIVQANCPSEKHAEEYLRIYQESTSKPVTICNFKIETIWGNSVSGLNAMEKAVNRRKNRELLTV